MSLVIYCSMIVVTFISLCLYERYSIKSKRKSGKPYELAKDDDLAKMLVICLVWPLVWFLAIFEISNTCFKRFINGE